MPDPDNSPEACARRAERMKQIKATAPHWQEPKPILKRSERQTMANDDDIQAGINSTIARIMARVDRNRVSVERERQHTDEDA